MSYCSNCGKKIAENTNFCSNCGTAFSPKTETNTLIKKETPSDVLSYLTTDENLLETEKSDEWKIYVTDKRVIFKKAGMLGKEIIEASYRHISSIEYKKGSPLSLIITGIVLIALAPIQYYLLHSLKVMGTNVIGTMSLAFLIILTLLGVISIVAYFFIKPEFKIHVVGREPLTISGKFERIIKIIRQYREKVETEIVRK